jgi:hypothetical protein
MQVNWPQELTQIYLQGLFILRCTFFRTPYFHSEIADKIQPDILITGNVERYLNSVPSDIERFDMKGLQIEKGCSQDLNFMAALKNILD